MPHRPRSLWTLIISLSAILPVSAGRAAPASTPIAEIPYHESEEGWITAPVTVNGEGPYNFIIDTGATLSVVFQNLADTQAFERLDQETKRILGIVGAERFPVSKIGNLRLVATTGANISLLGLESVILPDWDRPRETPQGVIGLDLLSQYSVLFDTETQRIIFYSADTEPPDAVLSWDWAPLEARSFAEQSGLLYLVEARIKRRKIPLILDLGSSGTIVNQTAWRELTTSDRTLQVDLRSRATRIRVSDVFADEGDAKRLRIRRFRVGDARWTNEEWLAYDIELFAELGLQSHPFGLLGADAFKRRNFFIDFQRQKIAISKKRR